ncbi:MAG: FAD-binding oxidoreductase [Vicinamibacterales bacterium]
MAIHQFRVRDIVGETPRAVLLRLDTAGDTLPFSAGQAAMVGLAGRAFRKPYSFANAPEEVRQSGLLEFLVEVGPDGQSRPNLEGARPGSVVAVEGPAGGFVLPRRLPRDLLFAAGGTGIAPLRSMMASSLARRNPPSITLIYSARTPDEFAFAGEWRRLSRLGRIRLSKTVTREAGAAWRGRRGRVQPAWISALVKGRDPLCFVCGPDAFVAGLMDMLRDAGVPAPKIRRERY